MFTDEAYCVRCRKFCKVRTSSLHVAGTSCVAWSSFGNRAQASCPTVLSFMALVFMTRRLEEPAVLHENVQSFEASIVADLLGDLYVMWSCVASAASLGSIGRA